MTKIAVIILNWNRAALTLASASSVADAFAFLGTNSAVTRLMVIDNASSEEDLGKLRQGLATLSKRVSSLDLRINTKNLGYAAGMNTGIKQLQDWGADYIWLLNNDTIVDRGAISTLVWYSQQHPDAAMLGATIVDPESRSVLTAGGYKYLPWLGWHRPNLAGQSLEALGSARPSQRLDYIDGAALWLRGDFIRRIGGLPTHQFLYFEELALTKLLDNDESVRWCPSALVYHSQAGSATTAELRARGTYHAAFSAFSYTLREHPICLPSVILSRVLGVSFRSMIRRQPGLTKAVFAALLDFIKGRPASYGEQ